MKNNMEELEREVEALRQANRALLERVESAENRQLAALQESEARFKALHNASFGGIVIHDKGRILDCNNGLSVITGYPFDELIGMDGLLLISEKTRDFVRSQIMARYEKPYEAVGVRKNGEEYPVRLEARQIPYRGKQVRVVEFRDISEQKKAEEELRLSQERLAIAMDSAHSGLWDWNVAENRVFYDSRYFTMAGYEPDEFPHEFDEWSRRVHPEDIGRCLGAIQDYLSGKVDAFDIDFRFLRKDGTWMWIRGHGKAARRDAQGAITRMVGIHSDISDLKQAEEALRASENRFRTLVNNSGDITQIIDVHGKALYVSGQVEKIVGYSTREILDMDSTLDLMHPEDRPGALQTLQACIPIPDARGSAEYRYWHKEGRWVWLEATGSNLLHNPFVKGLFLIVRDISERKRAESELRENESRLKMAQKMASIGDWSLDLKTGKLSWSEEIYSLFELDPARFGATYEAFLNAIHPDDREKVHAAYQQSLKDRSHYSIDHRLLMKDGRIKFVHEECASDFDEQGNPLFSRGTVQDVTDRLRAEDALRESERKLKALFASMTEMVALHELVEDPLGQPSNYRITDCNQAFSAITGIPREMAVGRLATEVYGTPVPPYLEEFSRVAICGEPHHFETYFPPMDKHFAISVVSPGKNRFATISTDITDTKKIQHVVASKNRELEQLVYVASHDLRSPLVNVDGYGRELEYALGEIVQALECGETSPSKLESLLRAQLPDMNMALQHIRAGTKQMDSLLKGLLKLSRMGRASLTLGTLSMNELVGRVLSAIEFQIRMLNASVSVGDLPPCRGDEMQVSQVFSNLIGNALKYLDPSRPGVISIRGVEEPGRCVYCVEDNGIGIPLEQREKVFELFYRLDPSKTDGEGLGLTIVRQILGRLDGDIWLDSTPGAGSRFYVALPRDKTSPAEKTETGA